ncbi:MAG: M14 family metallocarboxypeptidase, partial [Fimbriimonadales bacterium]|nr:M14 family metallocarboxypeptidase [Fimbriimonadales bacterium]
ATGVLILCVVLISALLAQQVNYDGYQVWRILIEKPAQVEEISTLAHDIWMIRGRTVDVCLSPEEQAALHKAGYTGEVLIKDVGALIRQQQTEFVPQDGSLFTRYMTLDEIYAVMRQFAEQNPRLVQLLEIGRSIENRPIYALRLTKDPRRARVYRDRPQVVINAMQHAREWITPPVVLYFAYRLVAEYESDQRIREYLDRMEVYIVPVVNPDGYVFTHTQNRLWRKNRRFNGRNQWNQPVYGVDLNRNWSYGWGGPGSSGNPSQETYRGTAPFSEPEAYSLSRWMLSLPLLRSHIDVHSYSQMILWPWGYTTDLAPFHAVFERVGLAQQAAILSVYGENYVAGPIATTIYIASGGMTDWVFGARGALSFTYELRDTGQYGFLLPPEQILPNCEEVYPAFLELLRWTLRRDWSE